MRPAVPDWVIEGLPPLNARTVLSRGQKLTALLLALLLALAFAWRPYGTFLALNVGMIVLYLAFSYYKLFLQFRAMRSPVDDIDAGQLEDNIVQGAGHLAGAAAIALNNLALQEDVGGQIAGMA